MARIPALNTPDLNPFNILEPERYGAMALVDKDQQRRSSTPEHNHQPAWSKPHAEHESQGQTHASRDADADIQISSAAFTHASAAISGALTGVATPFTVLHLSNVHAREPLRSHSYLYDVAIGNVSDFVAKNYEPVPDTALSCLASLDF